ncbi:hypothetical protein D5R40_19675 [Okeania hirsuta]|uniref:DUF2589 domain-containing protein n=1 Tax=Okeania hirsuta TaxID=1458930 RepID=A0A3N6P9F5_9CYAN|nr:hypothetical protein [Okeania hirsuta]RQH35900.1 hypothetical protein D5R40_19675 [Okeania hirsuta]
MSDSTLGDLITLITQEMYGTLEEVNTQENAPMKLQVSDVHFDIPAHLYLRNQKQSSSQTQPDNNLRMMVSLPSTLENPNVGKLGRIRMTITLEQNSDKDS